MAITISTNRANRTNKFIQSIKESYDIEENQTILRQIRKLNPNSNDFLDNLNKLFERNESFRQLFRYENKLIGWLARTFISGFDTKRKKEIIDFLQAKIIERIKHLEIEKPTQIEEAISEVSQSLNVIRQATFSASKKFAIKQGNYSVKFSSGKDFTLEGSFYEQGLKDKKNFENFNAFLSLMCNKLLSQCLTNIDQSKSLASKNEFAIKHGIYSVKFSLNKDVELVDGLNEQSLNNKDNFADFKTFLNLCSRKLESLKEHALYLVGENLSKLTFEDITQHDWNSCNRKMLNWTADKIYEYEILKCYSQELEQEQVIKNCSLNIQKCNSPQEEEKHKNSNLPHDFMPMQPHRV